MNTNVFWGGAAISIVVASWFLYRFLVPKSWREWTRAGIVQAFIIAFYAEMYGFPVTIYLLVRLFNLDVAGKFWDGNLWIYLTGAPGVMLVSMFIGVTIALFGVLLLIAGWREVYRMSQQGRLATGGPYALVRHPQYTGLFLALFGEGVVHWPTVISLAAFPVIVFAYARLAWKEERQMLEKFGNEYREYRRQVPMFLPYRAEW
ncbi:MAG: isoprenylcysteine carboxylmethyltransferase family protein [Rhodospirillales bacterium]|nr:isoprenylcysteine carboxylmethyltransferase family protein [Rhodospirillales bacterium]